MIRLIVRPTVPGHFTAIREVDGLAVVISSRQPLVDGARALLRLGHAPAELLTMRHAGKDYDSFEPAPIGQWATISYSERDKGSLRQEQWTPDSRYAKAPKVDKEGSSGTGQPS